DEARTYFLAYMNFDIYERVKNYEEQYLTDLAKSDKDIVRTQSGLTYKVTELGNMNKVAMRDRDSVAISYRATRLSGEEVDPATERDEIVRESVGKLIAGLKEGVKLVGEGGKVTLWIPSALAYGSAGAEKKGIKANEMLRYELEIKEVKK
ncbi:MAG: FKBP-type peptidyl-prolyl cis-trans isomerase, partial [Alistipes sp.]|nr:FKBP-type peptidyl-prolyl cis-trans isomerase [Alistipes sp.]